MTTRLFLSVLALFTLSTTLHAQNIGINATGALPDSSAALDISSTNSGILIPRLTNAQISTIQRPATGLMVFNTTLGALVVNTGSSGTPSWSRVIYSNTNSLGPTDNVSIRFNTNGAPRMIVDSLGNVGIGANPIFSASNPEKLLIDAGTTTSYNLMSLKGNINSYLQLNIQNQSGGNNASTDIVATANNGTETNNFIDMGINGSGYNANYFGGPNDAYLYNMGQNLFIGTGTSGKQIMFLTGGGTTGNERMRINASGNVGIGTNNPTSTLFVNGSVAGSIVKTQFSLTLDATHRTVILTSGNPSVTLPAASGCMGRYYTIVNQTGSNKSISTYLKLDGANGTNVPKNASITIQSDGADWYQIQ